MGAFQMESALRLLLVDCSNLESQHKLVVELQPDFSNPIWRPAPTLQIKPSSSFAWVPPSWGKFLDFKMEKYNKSDNNNINNNNKNNNILLKWGARQAAVSKLPQQIHQVSSTS